MTNSKQDIALKAITEELVKLKKIESIILFGSKAKNNKVETQLNGDYDIFVVLPFILIPLYYKKLKMVELILKNKLGIDASINPLPLFRLKRSKGNLLFFKMKNEGITLFGCDYLVKIYVGDISTIEPDELFSYYFSSVRFLIKDLKSFDSLSKEDSILLAYNIAKSTLYCSEIREYLNGIYIQDRRKILQEVLDSNYLNGRDESYKALISFALNVFQKELPPMNNLNLVEFWFLAKDYSLSTFRLLSKQFNLGTDSNESLERYQKKKFTIIKAYQYMALSFLKNHKISIPILLKKTSVERALYVSSYYLMESVEPGFTINLSKLDKANNALIARQLIKQNNTLMLEANELWHIIKCYVLNNWEIACGKSII